MRLVCAWALAAVVAVFGTDTSQAAHALGGTMSWRADPLTPNTALFTIIYVQRLDNSSLIPRPSALGDIYRDTEAR
jgi:hypothetical protein